MLASSYYNDSTLLEALLRAYKELESAGVSRGNSKALEKAKAALKKHIITAAEAL